MDEVMINNELRSLIEAIQGLIELDEEELENPEMMNAINEHLKQNLTPFTIQQSVDQIIRNLELQNTTREEAELAMNALKEFINELVYSENQYTGNKKILIDSILKSTFEVFDKVTEKYHVYSIELPMTVAEGAKVPTYAHETDACADLYALENTTLHPHTYGNKIRTGINIQLPEGWVAMIFPRSSIGAKTHLRLSNSVGIIDSGYRGELGVLYDNTSDEVETFNAGDRIAQLLVMPSYRFKAVVVDSLEDSDRGAGGFGSTGT